METLALVWLIIAFLIMTFGGWFWVGKFMNEAERIKLVAKQNGERISVAYPSGWSVYRFADKYAPESRRKLRMYKLWAFLCGLPLVAWIVLFAFVGLLFD